MRILFAAIFLALASLNLSSADPKPAAKTPLSEPRERLLKGNYAEARKGFESLTKDAKNGPAAFIGIAQSWRQEGKYDEARAALDNGLKQFADNADLLAAR